MSHIIPLLNKMRNRLGMYVGTPSLLRLAMFLHGYELAAMQLAGREPDPFLSDFRDWIHERYQTTTVPWEELIRRESTDDADAVRRFWELFDEFLARDATPPSANSLAAALGSPSSPRG